MKSVPVSVVIPCYGCAETIARAVNSIEQQTVRALEIILVDDASDAQTRIELTRILNSIGPERVKIIALPANSGPATARNAGWAAARGDFVAFLDADDAWHPRKLEIQTALMEREPRLALSGHRAAQLAAPDASLAVVGSGTIENITFRQLLLSNRFVTPAAMVRRGGPHRFVEGRRHMEDHLLWLQIAADGGMVARIDAVLAYTFKPPYGARGLSAALGPMELAELGNYRLLAERGHLPWPLAWLLCLYSLMKFVRRLIVAGARRIVSG